MSQEYSVSPWGDRFLIPGEDEYAGEFARVKEIIDAQRDLGREIVVVMGVGFVGAVMAAIVADTTDKEGNPTKFVIGMQRPSLRSYWKIPILNKGISPVKAEDPEVEPMIKRCVLEKRTLIATYVYKVLSLADVVVSDVQCDYMKYELGNVRNGEADMGALEESFKVVARYIRPDTLVLIETTVAPGTTENVAYPLMRKEFAMRGIESDPLLAHSFERVMPGRNYVASIRDFWRVCSGINDEARRRVVEFLSSIINVAEYPMTVMDRPIESETAKIIENSYRATILAFLDEWSIFAEKNGVDLIKVINAIKVRPTHNNIIFPGPGIGGYCLPKDGGLGLWAYKHILGFDDEVLKITPLAIDINDTRGIHAAQLVRDALKEMNRKVAASRTLILGASYREDVGDTRYSGSETIARKLAEMGAYVKVQDPYVDHWWELESQDVYPGHGHGKKEFFHNQEGLAEVVVEKELTQALRGADAVIFAVRHTPYLALDPDEVVQAIGGAAAIVDCFGILDDDKIRRYLELGCAVKGMGRGHIGRLQDQVKNGTPQG